MRDPERIDVFCSELAHIWKTKCPDWRFGQLIMNVLDSDPFYWEEDKFMKRLHDYFHIPVSEQ